MLRSLPHAGLLLTTLLLSFGSGCHLVIPDVSYQPTIHNPFPQLSRVAIAPFANQSDEPTVDGREFAKAYFGELQAVPGFEVVPLGVVEEAIITNSIDLSSADEARRLAKILGVDAVVIGSVTDYSPYYPPRCGLRVEWYAANSGFHEIPAGYGLPWGTPDEEYIPGPLVFEAEMALAKAQLATQTPVCPQTDSSLAPVPSEGPMLQATPQQTAPEQTAPLPNLDMPHSMLPNGPSDMSTGATNGVERLPPPVPVENKKSSDGSIPIPEDQVSRLQNQSQRVMRASFDQATAGSVASNNGNGVPELVVTGNTDTTDISGATALLPPGWPDERGFIPVGPQPMRPECVVNDGPVMTHTRIYHGNNSEFTEALASYVHFQDDARFGGWQSYLERSEDFIRFCCHLHISEMLSARGGAGETRVVWRWSESR